MTLKAGVSVAVEQVDRVADYTLRLIFSDGQESVVDFGPFLRETLNGETRQYLDINKFDTYRTEWGNLVWGDYEMCFSVEDLYTGQLVDTPLRAVAEERASYD
ncbi:MAG: DUF2442 domain-containing protein [Lentisphaerae bacterium]|nr:DUF2442 domain-containing protein [Lentisphaerota bacterium]